MTFDHDFWLFILLFFFPLFLGGKRKGEKNNQSRCQKSCFSARSIFWINTTWKYILMLLICSLIRKCMKIWLQFSSSTSYLKTTEFTHSVYELILIELSLKHYAEIIFFSSLFFFWNLIKTLHEWKHSEDNTFNNKKPNLKGH